MQIRAERLVGALAFLAVLAYCVHVFSDNKADVDLWGNCGFVNALPGSDEFRTTNTFSFTEPDRQWINHEWGGQLILGLCRRHLGNAGLLAMKVALGLAVIGIIWGVMRRKGVSPSTAFLYLILTISTMGYGFSTRPHHFTYLLFAAFAALLALGVGWPLLIACSILLGVVWANLHGAFFIGILLLLIVGIVGMFSGRPRSAAGASPWWGAVAAAGCFIAVSFINPYGSSLWSFILDTGSKPRPYLTEWAMFDPLIHAWIHPDFVVLAIVSAIALIASSKPRDPAWVTVLVLAFISALLLRRNIPLFAIAAAFVVPEHLESAVGARLEGLRGRVARPAMVVLLAGFACMSCVAAVRFNKQAPAQIEVPRNAFPVQVVQWMKDSGIKGNALVFFDWAEMAIWHLYPDCKVFLDGRFTDAYSEKTVDAYFGFLYMDEGWLTVLDHYGVDLLLLSRESDVYNAMLGVDGWREICRDDIAGLFVRTAGNEELAGMPVVEFGESVANTFFP